MMSSSFYVFVKIVLGVIFLSYLLNYFIIGIITDINKNMLNRG